MGQEKIDEILKQKGKDDRIVVTLLKVPFEALKKLFGGK